MPTISELQDVLDWQAVVVLRAVDEHQETTVAALSDATDLDRDLVENRTQQLATLGLLTGHEHDDEIAYELTGSAHGAIGAGLYDEYDLVGDPDLDELAEQVAALLDRRDELAEQVTTLREDAEDLRTRAKRQFGDREDVASEFESLLDDVDRLAEGLRTDGLDGED